VVGYIQPDVNMQGGTNRHDSIRDMVCSSCAKEYIQYRW
jgi:hypothetical protein